MTRDNIGHNRAVFDGLPAAVYQAICGLALWFALSAWLLFGGYNDTSLIFGVVSLFFLVLMLIPTAIWLTWRRQHLEARPQNTPAMPEWMAGTFETWTGRLKGSEAAVQVLLPIAAVAFGLTAIGIVLHIARAA